MHILIVDDDPAIRDVSARILTHAGFTVGLAEDGEAAWEAVGLGHYDLVVTDQNMPRLDGMGFIERVRGAGIKTPVILMTGFTNLIETKKAFESSLRSKAWCWCETR